MMTTTTTVLEDIAVVAILILLFACVVGVVFAGMRSAWADLREREEEHRRAREARIAVKEAELDLPPSV